MAWCNHATVRSSRIFNMAYQLNRFLWTYPSKVRYQSFVKASDPSFISHNLTEAVYWPCISPTRCLKSGFDHVYWEDAWRAECSRQCADGKLDWYRELLRLLLHGGNLMLLHYLRPMKWGLLFLRNARTSLHLRYWTALDSWDDRGEELDRSDQGIGSTRSMREGDANFMYTTDKASCSPVQRPAVQFTDQYRFLPDLNVIFYFTRLLSERILTLSNSTICNRPTANSLHDRTLVTSR